MGKKKNKKLICQINRAPRMLRRYIMGLEIGPHAELLWENLELLEENEVLKGYLDIEHKRRY